MDRIGVKIHRALSPDREPILRFIAQNMNEGHAGEASAAFSNNPPTIFVAMRGRELLGFACYDATAKGFFGPTELLAAERGKGIGTALLNACMNAMKEAGYAYAVAGWVTDARAFYEKTVGATVIEGSFPGVYERFIKVQKVK